MKSRRLQLFILVFCALPAFGGLVSDAGIPSSYEIIDLGLPPGALSSVGGINNAGQVVGRMEVGRISGVDHGFLWLPETSLGLEAGLHDLGSLGDSELRSAAYDINDNQTIVGWSETREITDFGLQVLTTTVWARGLMAPLGRPDPDVFVFAVGFAINNHGVVVGEDGTGFSCRPVIWRSTADSDFPVGPTVLEPPSGPTGGSARDINDLGQVVGYLTSACDSAGITAFLWLPEPAYGLSSGFHELIPGLDPIDEFAIASAINEQGVIAGRIFSETIGNFAFVWEKGVLTYLPTNPDAHRAIARGVNESSQVVGYWSIGTESEPFIWQDGVLQELRNLVPPGSGWDLQTAVDINDHGQILGTGRFEGERRAIVLSPVP